MYGAGFGITWSAGYGSTITYMGWGIGKLDSSGNILWEKKIYNGTEADDNSATAVAVFN